jgi:TolB-like protein
VTGAILIKQSVNLQPRKIQQNNVTEIKSIAVMPFKPIGVDQKDSDNLELGMADAIITRLSRVKQIRVNPKGSIFRFTGKQNTPASVGRELDVDAVLEGAVQRDGNHVRVTVQLVNVSSGKPLWADNFDESFTNVFAVQDSISAKVVNSLALSLSNTEAKTNTTKPQS